MRQYLKLDAHRVDTISWKSDKDPEIASTGPTRHLKLKELTEESIKLVFLQKIYIENYINYWYNSHCLRRHELLGIVSPLAFIKDLKIAVYK